MLSVCMYGQLGRGSGSCSPSLSPISELHGVTSVSAGEFHAVAIAQGGVYAWGYNKDGQLGNGSTSNRCVRLSIIWFLLGSINSRHVAARGLVECRYPVLSGLWCVAVSTRLQSQEEQRAAAAHRCCTCGAGAARALPLPAPLLPLLECADNIGRRTDVFCCRGREGQLGCGSDLRSSPVAWRSRCVCALPCRLFLAPNSAVTPANSPVPWSSYALPPSTAVASVACGKDHTLLLLQSTS